MKKKIVILGAGYAGVKAALTLNKKKKKEELDITIIDKHDYHTLLTELHEVAGNRVSEEAVKIPLKDIFRYTDVKIVKDEIKAFDFKNSVLSSDSEQYHYDYLILGVGSRPNFFGIPNMEELAFTLWSFEDSVRIREHIIKCFELAAVEKNEDEVNKLLTFVVAGAGYTGVEMIGELAHWTKDLAKEYGVDGKKVRLIMVDMLSRILDKLSEKNSIKAHRYMEKKLGVEFMLNTKILNISEDGFSVEGKNIHTRTIIWAAGVTTAESVDYMDINRTNRSTRIVVDEHCRTEHKNVFAVGDVSGLTDKDGREYPAMVETALYTGEGAAKNIINEIRNKELEKVTVELHGTMVSVGNFFGVSEIMGKILPVILSMFMKYFINIHYIWEIASFRGVKHYVYHEFLERKQAKILPEQHWSTRMQAWWLTPLRMFIGLIWIWEGVKKVQEKWLIEPKLASFLGMNADVSSQASEVACTTRLDNVFDFNIGIIHFMLQTENKLVEDNLIASEYLSKLEIFHIGNFSLVEFFLKNVVLANGTVSMIFQVSVVVLEILVGLMLIGGALNFVASVISLGLLTMFLTSTGMYEKSWWMLPVSIAIMGGAGRAFGLDYYFIPYLNNAWDRFWKNGKVGLFFKNCFHRDN